MADKSIPPLNGNSPIVDSKGQPVPSFLLLINQLLKTVVNSAAQAAADALAAATAALAAAASALAQLPNKADKVTLINAGTGLDGGGDLSADRTIDLADTAVTPGVYGDATNVAQITVDQQGRITDVVDVPITGGGGGGGVYAPLANGDTPGPVLIDNGVGACVMVEIS